MLMFALMINSIMLHSGISISRKSLFVMLSDTASHEKCEAVAELEKDVDLSVLEKAITDAGYKVIK